MNTLRQLTVRLACLFSFALPISQAHAAMPDMPMSMPGSCEGMHRPAFEHGPMGHEGAMGGHGMHWMGMLHHLDLSEAQRDKIFTLMHDQAPKMHELMKAGRQAHRDLAAASEGSSFDEAKAKSASDTLARSHAEMGLMQAKMHYQLMQILTPEQRKSMETFKHAHTHSDANLPH